MFVIVVGCGRVGSELAFRLFQAGHQVAVIDEVGTSFENLHPDYRGRTIEGEVLSEEVLKRAGIESADGLAAVTNSDSVNAVVGHVARTVYEVPNVVVRNYNPRWLPMHHAFGLQVVSSTGWGAQRIEELLASPAGRAVLSAGNGEVEIYEVVVPAGWAARPLSELLEEQGCVAAAVTRGGRAMLPTGDMLLEAGDAVHVSATLEGMDRLRDPDRGEEDLMFVLIAGGGRTGAQLATFLVSQRHHVRLIEHRPEILAHIHRELPTEVVFHGNATDPDVLERAGAPEAQVLAACMRGDADNLALCFVARTRHRIPRTIATINNPRNAWLFDKRFHVDVAINQAEILASLVEQEMSLGEMMTLLKLRRGRYSLVEDLVQPTSPRGGGRPSGTWPCRPTP